MMVRVRASIADNLAILHQIVTSPRKIIMTKEQGKEVARTAKVGTRLLMF